MIEFRPQNWFYRAVVAILNVIVALTVVVPVVTKLVTGRWGLFTNADTAAATHMKGVLAEVDALVEPEAPSL